MPAKKKVTEAQVEATPAAPKRRTPARTKKVEAAAPAVETTVKTKSAAPRKTAPKTPAATHKSTPRKSAPRAKAAPQFEIEKHRAEIEREAYFLWINRGGVHGNDGEDWLRAVEIVKERHS